MFAIRPYQYIKKDRLSLEETLRPKLLTILDDKTGPRYNGISYETVYTAMYRYSIQDPDMAAQFIESVIDVAAQQRRRFFQFQLLEHCGIELAGSWGYMDQEARLRVLDAMQTHPVFRTIDKERRAKHQLFIDVCLGLREPRRSEVIASAVSKLDLKCPRCLE